MEKEEFEELFYRYTTYLKELVRKPEKIKKTPEVETISRVIVKGEKRRIGLTQHIHKGIYFLDESGFFGFFSLATVLKSKS
ncbi:hypothetical protein KAU85_01730 [Candidatus Bathyarchaeota archaeon]|nr:hypothetical protein [Candidatus Bathyarchaeota archaeon]MCK4482363.1 hypothetical protein [Candidatus Bathyarchaeota archaeon]